VRQRAAAAVIVLLALVAAFALGRASVPPPGLEIRRGPVPPWIEVYQNGELVSEWHQTKDAELWRWLDMLLREDPTLYDPPAPGEPPRGRGPRLQQAHR
jgi:hypothetical protein